MKKRVLVAVLAAVMAVATVGGCGSKSNSEGTSQKESGSDTKK